MYSLRRFGIKLGLDTIRNILEGLENPQNNFACIHIAGTNGKGSVASTLATILHSAGLIINMFQTEFSLLETLMHIRNIWSLLTCRS